MKVFVIGGTGYLGRRILAEIAYDDTLKIVALRRGVAPADLRLRNVEWIEADTGHVERYAQKIDGTELFLYMGGIHCPSVTDDREALMAENAVKLERLLGEVRRRQVDLFLYVTSVAALGGTGNVTGDEGRVAKGEPGSAFEASMRRGLELVEAERPRLKSVVALVGPTFGQDDPGFLQRMILEVAQGRGGTLPGGRHFCSPIHVDDLRDGLLKVILKGDDNRRYILCGEPIELANLAHMTAQAAGGAASIRSSGGLSARLHAGLLGRAGLSPYGPALVSYLVGGNYAYESHRAKKELRWSHGRLRDRIEETLRSCGSA